MQIHIKDIVKHTTETVHLSMLEHGAYNLLLDRYYTTEQPIPKNQAYRIARAYSQKEREAVDTVLREFFIDAGDVWKHKRCEALVQFNSLIYGDAL